MYDWDKIKTEYTTIKTTYKKLAEKYGVAESTIRKKAMKEKWTEKRNKIGTKKEQKTIEIVTNVQAKQQAKQILSIEDVANELLEKAKLATEQLAKIELVETTRDKLTGTNAQGQAIERTNEKKSLKIVDGNISVAKLKQLTDTLVNLDKLRQNENLEKLKASFDLDIDLSDFTEE